ncbi:hypothetical protein BKH40_08100 [Helicobacter sp. 11S02629-2]|nr:hypothetical protein BKH40_08100 [Helicobacter sp. 11S02629-2]
MALIQKAKHDKAKYFPYANPNAPKGGTLRSYGLGGFDSLNMFVLKGNGASGLNLIYETLMTQSLDEPYAIYPLIAKEVSVAKDNSGVRFKLDPSAKFSDGVPITSEDVKFSFYTLIDKGSPAYARYYAGIEKVVIINKYEVEFLFRTTQNIELPLITTTLPILPEHYYMKDGKNTFGDSNLTMPLGSGPYILKSYSLNKKLVYEKNPNYWSGNLPINKGSYNFKYIVYDYYKDDGIALQGFLSGGYDYRVESSAKNWALGYKGKSLNQKKFKMLEIRHSLGASMQGFYMNTRRALLSDIVLRKALTLAFDFKWSNENLFFSQYVRTKSYFENSIYSSHATSTLPTGEELKLLMPYSSELPKGFFDHEVVLSLKDRRTSLMAAQKMLHDVGYKVKDDQLYTPKGQKVELTMLLDSELFTRVVLPYAKNLKALGIKLSVRVVDEAQYQNMLNSFDYDMIVSNIWQSPYPGSEQSYYFGSESADIKGSSNYSGIKDKVVDALIKKLNETSDQDLRIAIIRAMDRVLMWGYYVVPHYYGPFFRIAISNNIKTPKVFPKYGVSPYLWWSANPKEKYEEPYYEDTQDKR